MKRVFVLIATVVLLASQAFGQQQANELSLSDCIDLALKNRASIIAAHGREQLAAAGKRSALGAFLPRVSASYNTSKATVTGIASEVESGGVTIRSEQPDQDRDNKSISISGDITIGPGDFFNLASSAARHASAKLDVISFELDLILSVKTSYYLYLAAFENVSVQEEAVKRAEEQLKLIESRFELGSASRSEVLKQKVQAGSDRVALLRAKNLLSTTQATLAYIIGVDPNQEWRFSTEYSKSEYNGTLEQAIAFGLEKSPRLLSLDKSLSASNKDVSSAISGYLPTITGFARFTDAEGTSGDTISFFQESQTKSYGLQINYGIFDGFLREQRVTQAKVVRNNVRAQLNDARYLAVSNIKTAYLDIVQLREQKIVSKENVEAATEDMKITQERYNLGAASILDLLKAQESLKQAQVQLIQADFDLNTSVAELENAMGKQ